MTSSPVPANEDRRLAELHRYCVLDTPVDPRFETFTRLAADLYACPVAVATVIESNRIWFKSRVGVPVTEIPRERAFCSYAIMSNEVLVVEDAAADDRFRDNPLVTGDLGIRFYAGAPIMSLNGYALGSLAILDQKPRTFDEASRQHLAGLADGLSSVLELHRANQDLRRAATHDALTGLANRALLRDCLDQAVQGGAGCAVLAIDLDRFKAVNDTLGHAAGDAVLKEMASRMRNMVRHGDLVARLGGDEFVIVLGMPVTEAEAHRMAERLLEAVDQPVAFGSAMADIGASVGLAMAPRDGDTADRILQAADLALYEAKRNGRGRVCRTLTAQLA